MADLTGQVFAGRYTVQKQLGVGGMGTVYLAFDQVLNRPVAIKLLNANLKNQAHLVERFYKEARALAKLTHNNIVSIYDIGVEDDVPYLIMQYLSGQSLAERFQLLKRNITTLPSLKQVVDVIDSVASALHHAHTKDIIHRDVKPSNIMFTEDGDAILTDFGIARLIGNNTTSTATGAQIGTPYYMPPEQWEGKRELTQATDQYALAVVAFQLLTGRLPFEANSVPAIMQAHIAEVPPTLKSIRPDVPQALSDVIYRAMSKKPEDRYPSIVAFSQALRDAIESVDHDSPSQFFDTLLETGNAGNGDVIEGIPGTIPSPGGLTKTLVTRLQTPVGLSMLIALILVVGIVILLVSSGNPSDTATPIADLPTEPGGDTDALDGVIVQQTVDASVNQALTATVAFQQTIDAGMHIAGETLTAEFIVAQTATATLWTATPTATDTPTITPSPTPTATITPSSTPSPTPTATITPSSTPSPTPTATITPSVTPSPTPTATIMPSSTPSPTPTATASFTPLPTHTQIPSPTPVPSSAEYNNALSLAYSFSGHSANWTPIIATFNGDRIQAEMVLVPQGRFEMGSTDSEIDAAFALCNRIDSNTDCNYGWFSDESPQVSAQIDEPFWLDRYEVSNADFVNFLNANGNSSVEGIEYLDADDDDREIVYSNGSWVINASLAAHPVMEMTWFGARDFCAWRGANFALPSEPQWEFAARGTEHLIYPWGNSFVGSNANHCDVNCGQADWATNLRWIQEENNDGYQRTAPVTAYPQGASWVGAYNMSGNVWEWVSSVYQSYPYAGRAENLNNTTDQRVLRGGAFDFGAESLRTADRGHTAPDDSNDSYGFRCMRNINAQSAQVTMLSDTPSHNTTATNTTTDLSQSTSLMPAFVSPIEAWYRDGEQVPASCPGTVNTSITAPSIVKNLSSGLRIRVSPSTNGRQISGIPADAGFVVLDGPVCNDGYEWWLANFYGNIGWIVGADNSDGWLRAGVVSDLFGGRQYTLETDMAYQEFQGGMMVWVSKAQQIYVFLNTDHTWQLFVDDWDADRDAYDDPSIVAPSGLYQPVAGFGKVWRNNDDLQSQLGWALIPEDGYSSRYQYDYTDVIDNAGNYLGGIGYRTLYDRNTIPIYVFDDGTWSK